MDKIADYFGDEYRIVEKRIASYHFVSNFIKNQHHDWSVAPNTDRITKRFIEKISSMSDRQFAFLLCHAGYIPEFYLPDSSQETLFSKLIEAIVLEWASRIGFHNSYLPTQKASMEDVSILDDNNVIVCDAKSFRLGRSQGAPNVKDVLKHADIKKWLQAHKGLERVGGLVTFPSQHDWKKGSDFYQYTTDKSSPTVVLYYEHLAFILIARIERISIITFFKDYGNIFPNIISKNDNNRSKYYSSMEENLLNGHGIEWDDFKKSAYKISYEHVHHTTVQLNNHLDELKKDLANKYDEIDDIETLKEIITDMEFSFKSENYMKQQDRIVRFRRKTPGYL